MSERNDQQKEQQLSITDAGAEEPIEGVRLINREEAEAAVESGVAISRNSQGRLVSLIDYESDEPEPSWADTGDAAAPTVRILGDHNERVSAAIRMPESVRGSATSSPSPTVLDDDFDILDLRGDSHGDEVSQARPDDEPIVTPPGGNSMPHWTEPPTGEVPPVLGDINASESTRRGDGDGDDGRHWSFEELGDASKLGSPGESPEAALDAAFDALGDDAATEQPPKSDKPEATAVPEEQQHHTSHSSRGTGSGKSDAIDTIEEKVESLKKASIVTRSATGVVGVALAIAAFSAGPTWAMLLALTVVTLAAVEYFDALRRVGYRPATALGLIAVIGAVAGTYARGEAAIPLVFALATAFAFLWYLTGVIKDSPTANVAVTLLGVMWIGVFGSYAALLLREPQHQGIAFLGGAVMLVVAYDTFAYLGGVLAGRHLLAPDISPSKTWEGLATGTVASVLLGGIVVPLIHPWGIWDGLALGIVIACVAPIGDLAESMIKRDLGLKDMGRLLPGHGGVLDRFDALLFVLPATYYLVRLLDLA